MARNEKLAALANKIPVRLKPDDMPHYIDQIKARDTTMVTGVFRNLEKPGETVRDVPFRMHKGSPITTHTFHDGGIYTIPYGLAYHLEHKCNKIQYKRGNGVAGSSKYDSAGIAIGASSPGMEGGQQAIESYLPRYSFLSVDVPQRSNILLPR